MRFSQFTTVCNARGNPHNTSAALPCLRSCGDRKFNRPSPRIVAWAGRGKRRFAAVLLLSEPGLAVAAVARSQCAARAAWLG